MKKIASVLIALVLMMTLVFAAAAEDSIIGKWTLVLDSLYEEIAAQTGMTLAEAKDMYGEYYDDMLYLYEFREDGTFVMHVEVSGDTIHVEGIYTIDGDQLIMTPVSDETTIDAELVSEPVINTWKLEDGKLYIITASGTTSVLVPVAE